MARKPMRVGQFIVQRKCVLRGIFGRSINAAAQFYARRNAANVIQQVFAGKRANDSFKIGGRFNRKTMKQQSAMLE